MLSPEIKKAIRQEIKQQMNVILNCVLQESTTEDQEIDQVYPGATLLEKRPVVHPYGLVSRAPKGTIGVTARVGEHIGSRLILGCRDTERADIDLNEGDVCLYDANGNQIELNAQGVHLGSSEADNPIPLGNETLALFSAICDTFITAALGISTAPGNPITPNPAVVAQFTALKLQYITNTATNILAQKVFAEKGI